MFPGENCVEIDYEVVVNQKSSGEVKELHERHRMRYLFVPEVTKLLAQEGLILIHGEEWMTGRAMDLDTWNACSVARLQTDERESLAS